MLKRGACDGGELDTRSSISAAQCRSHLSQNHHCLRIYAYACPTSSSGLYSQGEAAGFRAVSKAQRPVFVQATQYWDDLITQTFQQTIPTGSNIQFGFTTINISYAKAYSLASGSSWFLTGPELSTTKVDLWFLRHLVRCRAHAGA